MSASATARTIDPRRPIRPATAWVLACLALAACGRPDFDERYAQKQRQLESEAAQMQDELDRRMSEKPGLEPAATPQPGGSAAARD